MTTPYELLTANFSHASSIRKVTEDGVDYLVANLSLIPGDGVLNGSKGALFYPAEEVVANVRQWDGVPITLYHPVINGEHVSAQHPGVLESSGLGFLRNARYERGKLRAEGWFDLEKVKACDARQTRSGRATVLNRLEAGQPIELSTGLFTDNDPTPGVTRNGRAYDQVARNYRADHLAVLPDQVGACSLNDGCGVHVHNTTTTNEAPTDNATECGEVVLTLLHAATSAHILHLKTRSFAAHSALDGMYKDLPGLVDALVEAYQGVHGIIETYPSGFSPPTSDPVEFVRSVRSYLQDNRAAFGDESELQNQVDEVLGSLDSTLYKLRFLS